MRRKEFAVDDSQDTIDFLQEMSFGFLGTIDEVGWPTITPLNFVYLDGALYFHGSKIGEKMRNLKQHNQVVFSVAKEYARIPSYFSDPKLACPATTYFKSAYIKGTAHVLEDPQEKAHVMNCFMQKLQPEGGYDLITSQDPEYLKNLRGTAVVKITIKELTAKFKFGQNLSEARMETVVSKLNERGEEIDLTTAELMQKYCPHHQKR
ncbi:MAG: flavin-nucleotide-binding protein [Bacilli bacterium]|nr:flavin-nucleotide-binding protein [Bacilli bacterium]